LDPSHGEANVSTETSERLQAIEGELNSILEARISELMASVRETETTSRKIVQAEMELSTNRSVRENLEGEIEHLRGDVAALRTRVDEARGAHTNLWEERDNLREELQAVEREAREARREVEAARSRMSVLNDERDHLRNESGHLQGKLNALEQAVTQLREVRENMLSSIASLQQTIAKD
jgi:chromosome segregation ATPase